MSPRKPKGLPYLQLNRVGRLSYVRRIPPDLQVFAGNQKVIRRSLGLSTAQRQQLTAGSVGGAIGLLIGYGVGRIRP